MAVGMKDLTTGKESKVILFFALPMLIGNVFQQSYNIIDSIIVGNYLGKEAVAAIGAAFPIIFFLISMVIGIASGGTIIVAQFFGAKDYGSVKKTIDTLLIFLFFASLIVTGIGLLIAPHVFYWMNLEQSSIPDAINYIMIYFSGMIFFFGFNGVSAILRGLGDSKTPLYFLVIATVINIGLDFLFILGMNMGVSGAAFATLVSQGLAFAAAVIYLNKKHEYIKFSFRNITFDKEIFRKAIRIGLPSGIQQSLVAIGAFVMFWIVNDFGTNATAAYSIASRIDSFALIPAMNFAMALTTFVGQNVGAGLEARAIKGLKTTMVMSGIISVSISIIVILFGHNLMSVFIDDPEVVKIGYSYLMIVGSFYLVFSLMFCNSGFFRGAGDTLIPMFITLLSLWVFRVPASIILSKYFGTDGIWWGIPIAWAIGLIISYGYYLSGKWRNKAVVKKAFVPEPVEETTNL